MYISLYKTDANQDLFKTYKNVIHMFKTNTNTKLYILVGCYYIDA